MNTAELRVHIDAYLNLRGSLGLQTEITGYYLRELSNYVEAQGFSWPIRTQTILEWISAASPHCGLPGQRTRLTQARCFLKHLKASVPDTEVPGPGLLPHQPRPKPRWYSAEEITELLQATLRLWEPGSLSQRTPYLIIGLLASTGLRAGEVIALTVDDVRLKESDAQQPVQHLAGEQGSMPHVGNLDAGYERKGLGPVRPGIAGDRRFRVALGARLHVTGLGGAAAVQPGAVTPFGV